MERSSSTFVRDIVVLGGKKVLLGISSRLTSAEYTLPNEFYTFVLVFIRSEFVNFLAGTGVAYTLHQEPLMLRSCNKNLLQCMFDNSEINRSGVLMCITTRAYKDFKQINDVLYRNSAHVDLYAYNPQSTSLLFSEALHFSVKQRNFQFRPIAAKWVDLTRRGIEWCISAICEEQENILERLPRLSFDLETLATNEVAFPLGIFEEEKIASASIVVEYCGERYHYLFLLAPWKKYDVETTRRYLVEKLKSSFVVIFAIETELELVQSLFVFLYTGMALIPFALDTDTVTILTGYNILNFDIPYLYKRLYFHGQEAFAHRLSLKYGWRKNILLDAFVVEKNHFSHAIGTNFKLSNVVRVFIKDEKLDIEIAALRRLYREHHFDVNSCNNTVSVNGVNTPSINYTCWYNIVDSQLVLNLINAQNIITLMFVQARALNSPIDGILSVRNARALASSINIFMFERGYFFSRGPPTIIFPRIKRLFAQDAEKFCKLVREIDRGELIDMVGLLRGDVPTESEHESDDEEGFVDADGDAIKLGGKGGFGGGANFARRGCFLRLASMDFTSLYATIKLYARIDFNNVSIVPARMLVQRPMSQLEALVAACDVYVYDHPDIEEAMCNIKVRGTLMEMITRPQRLNELPPDTRILIILPTCDAVLSGLVQHLIDSRTQCKLQYANDPTNVLAKTNELTLKQRTCAIFGCLGFEHFEASSPCSAAAITALARQFIILASHFLTQQQLETIYIDTDGLIFFFDGGLDELRKLSEEITKRLNAPPINLKPEHVYPLGIIASKKKYILQMPDGSVKINGFLKWAIEPVQVVVRAWFSHLLATIPKNATYREFRWKIDPEDVVVACFTELELLWRSACARVHSDDPQHGHNVHLKQWQMFVKINKRSPTEAIATFSRDMRDLYGVVEDGTRVPVYKILDDMGKSCMLYADGASDVHRCRVDVRALLMSVLAYVLNFTLCPEKPAPGIVDRAWVRFSTGSRKRFSDVAIFPEEVRRH